MPKNKTSWFCTSCGNESPKWMGQCPACGEWNTMVEETVVTGSRQSRQSASKGKGLLRGGSAEPEALKDISLENKGRISLGHQEIDRLLGGGVVEGSLILIGGEPGIGKSTLSLQIPLQAPQLKTLYASGEESPRQIKLRGQRLGGNHENCYILGETSVENIIAQAEKLSPGLLIVDSIQTVCTEDADSSAGTIVQIKESAAKFLRYAKESGTPVILIGHITKDGNLAGPKILEHIVDVVLQFEGDSKHAYRILRSIKNRFGSTSEIAVYEMTGTGLREVSNPSEMLIPMHDEDLSGTAVAAIIDGTRPFLVETQALVSTAAYGTPQRSATGFDVRRMNMLLAVLEKRAGFRLAAKDVFLNIAGGLRIADPATDLAIAAAILSSNFDLPVSPEYAFAGEIGLSGEIRPVSQIDRRVSEAGKLGFSRIFVSSYSKELQDRNRIGNMEVIQCGNITDMCKKLFK